MEAQNRYIILLICCMIGFTLEAQFNFTDVKSIECTEVKSQDRTGTCWSFATSSFIESELIRLGNKNVDLSEMFVVRNIYKDKAFNYIMRQGKANFSEGSLSHDLLRIAGSKGMVPESAYSGKLDGNLKHDHSEMEAALKGFLDGVLKSKRLSNKWMAAFEAILDTYIGEAPSNFTVDGMKYTPKSYGESMGLNMDDYINITSFTHHPFYSQFILEIPDNYSNGSFYNVPLEDLMSITNNAIENGFSIAWDGDVSEKGFSAREGIAVLPFDESRKDIFKMPGGEVTVTQEKRQELFENYSTTDDHLMHLVGTAKDQKGIKYFKIKNSWGKISDFEGFLYMSEAYLKMKTISILVHKDAIPSKLRTKMGI